MPGPVGRLPASRGQCTPPPPSLANPHRLANPLPSPESAPASRMRSRLPNPLATYSRLVATRLFANLTALYQAVTLTRSLRGP